MTEHRKLIEVALPLEAINREAAHEKSVPRKGHPATLHLWWARRPLAACRAVLFAQLVDDPSSHPELFPTEEEQDRERQRLFDLIERLVKWENSNDEQILAEARAEIRRWCGDNPPPVLDPFAGGGSIPLEAQRLGLEAHASDLNPIAVLINKALLEIPPRWANQPPIRPWANRQELTPQQGWTRARGLAEDVRYYGQWISDQATQRLGHLYPRAVLPDGEEATVVAWLWARTVRCPSPACRYTVPLIRSFWLSNKKGREAWIRHDVDDSRRRIRFEVGHGTEGPTEDGTIRRSGATCLACRAAVPLRYIQEEGKRGRVAAQLLAIVAQGHRQRVYLSPNEAHEDAAAVRRPDEVPESELENDPRNLWCVNYGLKTHADLFTNRQLMALATFAKLIGEVRGHALKHAAEAGVGEAESYATSMVTYLAFSLSKLADWSSSLCSWIPRIEGIRDTFARQALPMVWDYAEINPLSQSVGNWNNHVKWVSAAIDETPACGIAVAMQADVINADSVATGPCLVATDPPYYDNVSYANLSDFFYVWLRRCLRNDYPDLLATLLTPKAAELIADPIRHPGQAEAFFERGFAQAFGNLTAQQDPNYPMTVFYAFRQSEADSLGTVSTGWETMLEGMLRSGLAVTATWPVRSERGGRMRDIGSNALASSIVLACRSRRVDAGITDRQGFLRALRETLPADLKDMQKGNIAPVDLAQAAIGPGMAVFSSYAKVVEPTGEAMRVRTALGLINQVLDQVLAEQEGEFDADTRWAIKWFEQFGFDEGPFGTAETLFTATATSFNGLKAAGIVDGRAGKVWLVSREDLPHAWDPSRDARVPVWEVTVHLIKRLEEQGEDAAAALLARVGHLGDVSRDLAYRLYNICERRKWAKQALAFNTLVTAWPELTRAAQARQATLDV